MNDSAIREAASIGSSICTSIENDAWYSIINAVYDSVKDYFTNT